LQRGFDFQIVSDTEININNLPFGTQSGPITVVTPGGFATSTQTLTVLASVAAPPTILGFTPSSGAPGQSVTIFGSNFNFSTTVLFNGVAASFPSDVSFAQITVSVPEGATSGPITVI